MNGSYPSLRSLAARRPLGSFGAIKDADRGSTGTQGGLMEWTRIWPTSPGRWIRSCCYGMNIWLLKPDSEGPVEGAPAALGRRASEARRDWPSTGVQGPRRGGDCRSAGHHLVPDTILSWYRRLVARKFDGSRARRTAGRPRIDREVEELIVRMAEGNRSWGYDRIVGAVFHPS